MGERHRQLLTVNNITEFLNVLAQPVNLFYPPKINRMLNLRPTILEEDVTRFLKLKPTIAEFREMIARASAEWFWSKGVELVHNKADLWELTAYFPDTVFSMGIQPYTILRVLLQLTRGSENDGVADRIRYRRIDGGA